MTALCHLPIKPRKKTDPIPKDKTEPIKEKNGAVQASMGTNIPPAPQNHDKKIVLNSLLSTLTAFIIAAVFALFLALLNINPVSTFIIAIFIWIGCGVLFFTIRSRH